MRCYGLLCIALFVGCDTPPAAKPTMTPNASAPADSTATGRDNTAVNERDQDPAAKTPLDQGQGGDDIKVTADIRTKIVNHSGMSINGRNVKIITEAGKVTLRGPVNSQEEKDLIENFAKDTAGAANVVSQIEIAP